MVSCFEWVDTSSFFSSVISEYVTLWYASFNSLLVEPMVSNFCWLSLRRFPNTSSTNSCCISNSFSTAARDLVDFVMSSPPFALSITCVSISFSKSRRCRCNSCSSSSKQVDGEPNSFSSSSLLTTFSGLVNSGASLLSLSSIVIVNSVLLCSSTMSSCVDTCS